MTSFRFELQENQINTILTLFYNQKNLFFPIKTGFAKSFIFQIILFMFNRTKIIIIFISLKLL